MAKKSTKKNRMLRWLRRIFKLSLWIAGISLLLFTIAVIFVRVQYPELKVLELISEAVQTNTGMPLQIEDVSWQLPLRLVISRIALGYPESAPENETPLFSLNRFSVSFRLLPLLKRRLHVQSVSLVEPKLYWDPHRFLSFPQKTQLDSIPLKSEDSSTRPSAALPLSLRLSSLNLNDFDCTVILPDSLKKQFIRMTGLNLNISNAQVPRDVAFSLEDVRGQAHFYTKGATLQYAEEGFETSSRPEIDLQATWKRNQQWQVHGAAGLASVADPLQKMRVQIDLQGIGKGDSIRIEPFRLELHGDPVLTVTGHAKNLIQNPEFQAQLDGQFIDLNKIRTLALSFLPPAMSTLLEAIHIQGNFLLPKGEVQGDSKGIRFRIQSSLHDGYLAMQSFSADSLFYNLDIQGNMNAANPPGKSMKLGEVFMQGNAGFDAFQVSVNDSTTARTGPLFLRFSSRMDSCGLPQEGYLAGTLSQLLNGQLGLDFKWGRVSGAPQTLESVFVQGALSADSLDISEIPNLQSPVQGKANLEIDLTMPNLYQAVVDVGVDVPGLSLVLQNAEERLPPLQLISAWALQTEPSFEQIWLDSGLVRLNDLLQARFKGQMDVHKQAFWIQLNEAVLYLDHLTANLPPSIRESLNEMTFGGQTILKAEVNGSMAQPDSMKIQSTIALKNGAFYHILQNMQATDLEAEIVATGTPQKLKGNGSLDLGRLNLGAMRHEPLENSSVHFDWQWMADKFISFTDAIIRNDSLNLTAQLNGGLQNLSTEPTLHVSAEIDFNQKDWIETVREMMIRGKTKIAFDADQTNHPSRLAISGKAVINNMDVEQGEALTMTNIRGRAPFQIQMDLENAMIVSDSNYTPPSWIDYESRRSQFRSLNPDQGSILIKNINVAGYQMTDLAMDIDIGKGYVQAPWFMVNTYDGNVGGYLQVFLGSGQPETIAYKIHAQAARINAAALGNIPIKKREEAELNATMAFSGSGVDIEKEMEMNGYFYITKIGPQFASLLLQGMDPNEEDRNIRTTRWLLNRGWKPTLFSFEMRHGYVYPSLSLSQPWYSPIRLPETLSFGRLPLKFFIENSDLAQVR